MWWCRPLAASLGRVSLALRALCVDIEIVTHFSYVTHRNQVLNWLYTLHFSCAMEERSYLQNKVCFIPSFPFLPIPFSLKLIFVVVFYWCVETKCRVSRKRRAFGLLGITNMGSPSIVSHIAVDYVVIVKEPHWNKPELKKIIIIFKCDFVVVVGFVAFFWEHVPLMLKAGSTCCNFPVSWGCYLWPVPGSSLAEQAIAGKVLDVKSCNAFPS